MIDPSLFVEFFGDYPYIRVLDFLLENDIFDYSKKDISRHANVSWNTLETVWGQLERMNVIVHTRKVGKAEMYKINEKNILVQQLMELNTKLLRYSLEKIKPMRTTIVAADSD